MSDRTTPAVGAIVTVLDTTGSTVARALSGPMGAYRIHLPRPGRYELRALRIGFAPTRLSPVAVRSADTIVRDVVLTDAPVVLPAIIADEDEHCRVKDAEASELLRLWEQIRAALAATELADQEGSLAFHVLQLESSQERSGRRRDLDSTKARETITEHGFAATPAETLAASGYLRARTTNGNLGVLFDAPSAEALVADTFLATHCFHIQDHASGHPDWIGIAFKPIRARDTIADVAGTVWLTRDEAELRQVDFRYTNTRAYLPLACGRRPAPDCDRDLGGTLHFVRLPTGEWFINRWVIRIPGEVTRDSLIRKKTILPGKDAVGRMRGGTWFFLEVARLSLNSGSVARVTRDGVELYRDDSTLAAIARVATKQAGPSPANLAGVVTSPDGRPVPQVVVTTDTPVRAAITDSTGYFEISTLPPGPIGLAVTRPGTKAVRFRVPLAPDSTRRVQLKLPDQAATRPQR